MSSTDLSKIMDMSLDEYIACKKTGQDLSGGSNSNVQKGSDGKFKAERRKHKYEEDGDEEEDSNDDEMLPANEKQSFGIWKGPDPNTNYLELDCTPNEVKTEQKTFVTSAPSQNCGERNNTNGRFDLREKITGQLPVNSQQWRLMYPNVLPMRPAGMPPLVPQHEKNNFEYRNRGRNRRRGNGGNWGNNNNNNYNRGGYGAQQNNGRVQRFNQRKQTSDMINKNIKLVVDRLNRGQEPLNTRDLTIEVTSDFVCPDRNATGRPDTHVNNSNNNSAFSNEDNNNAIKSLLSVTNSVTNEMMPMLASKFLDFWQNGGKQAAPVHKPDYDMKMQKQIHEIQKKELTYKCNGDGTGAIISSDGPGINNCKVVPRASGVTLNYRFG